MKNEETSRETPWDNAKVKMKTECHSAIGGKNSAFCILHSAFLSGFTLLEVMIASALFGLVMAGTLSVYIMCNKIWHSTSVSMQTVRESSLALSRLVYGLDTNSGLRAASMVTLNTNFNGIWDSIKYWETGTKPPTATNAVHDLASGSPDGSWRIAISNLSGGVKYVDYNSKQRNLLFRPVTNSVSQRQLICNYVSVARVTTNASGTIGIQLTAERRDGMFIASNMVSTSVKMRNKP